MAQEKTPQEKLQEFLEKQNLRLDVRMVPDAEETRSGKLLINVSPTIVVTEEKK